MKQKIILMGIIMMFIVLALSIIPYITEDFESITDYDINKAEELYKKSLENQLPIEEQIEELRRVEIKLYGKEISDYDAIRNK